MSRASLDGYAGIPYLEGGRGRAGCDCWGIVRLYLIEVHGLDDLPLFEGPTIPADHPYLGEGRAGRLPWRRVERDEIRVGDVGLWLRRHGELHSGVVVAPGLVLHNDSPHHGSRIQPIAHVTGGEPEWWRHAALEHGA